MPNLRVDTVNFDLDLNLPNSTGPQSGDSVSAASVAEEKYELSAYKISTFVLALLSILLFFLWNTSDSQYNVKFSSLNTELISTKGSLVTSLEDMRVLGTEVELLTALLHEKNVKIAESNEFFNLIQEYTNHTQIRLRNVVQRQFQLHDKCVDNAVTDCGACNGVVVSHHQPDDELQRQEQEATAIAMKQLDEKVMRCEENLADVTMLLSAASESAASESAASESAAEDCNVQVSSSCECDVQMLDATAVSPASPEACEPCGCEEEKKEITHLIFRMGLMEDERNLLKNNIQYGLEDIAELKQKNQEEEKRRIEIEEEIHRQKEKANMDESRVNASKKTTAEDSGIGEDHALAGEIDLYRTSPTFIPYSNPVEKSLAMLMMYMGIEMGAGPPEEVISPNVQEGHCWAMQGSTGQITILLPRSVAISAISIEHVETSTEAEASALNEFAVYGHLASGDDAESDLLVSGQYDLSAASPATVQTFAVPAAPGMGSAKAGPMAEAGRIAVPHPVNPIHAYDRITVHILNNHGNDEYTCIYRIRVHGDLVPATYDDADILNTVLASDW